jgi:hypothetical protein
MREFTPINYADEEKIPQLIKTKFLYLCSRNRSTGGINDFIVNLPTGYFKTTPNQQMKISLQNITLVKEWYETQAGLSAEYENSVGNCSIPDGSYTVETLVDTLNNDLSFSTDYIVSYNYPTNKLSFQAQNVGAFIKTANSGYLLGLNDYTTYNGDFTSDNPVIMVYNKTVYINTNLSSSGASLDNINYNKIDYSTILQTIPIQDASFDIIQYTANEYSNSGLLIDPSTLDSIRLWISTDRGYTPTLNENWEVCLKIEFFVVK